MEFGVVVIIPWFVVAPLARFDASLLKLYEIPSKKKFMKKMDLYQPVRSAHSHQLKNRSKRTCT
jgi:hypothetical protein